MNAKTALKKAIKLVGKRQLADAMGIKYQAINGWMDRNRMPDTEYSCRTNYAAIIEDETGGKVTVTDVLGHIPACLEI